MQRKIPFVAIVLASLLAISPVVAQPVPNPLESHKSIQPYLSKSTVMVAWLDLQELDADSAVSMLTEADIASLATSNIEYFKTIQNALVSLGVTRVYWISDLASIADGPTRLAIPCNNPAAVQLLVQPLAEQTSGVIAQADGNVVLVGSQATVDEFLAADGSTLKELSDSLASVKSPHGAAFATPTYVTMTLFGIMRSAMNGVEQFAETAEALSSVQWLSLGSDLNQSVELTMNTNSPSDAKKVAAVVEGFLTNEELDGQPGLKRLLTPQLDGSRLQISVSSRTELAEKVEALKTVLNMSGARELQLANNMKQVALSLHNYASAYGRLPPQSLVDAGGKRLFSWRVLVLPFLEQMALYEKFNFDEPWDSAHNLEVAKTIPGTFSMPNQSVDENGVPKTQILAPMTKRSVFGRPGEAVDFRDITDGTSNTIWFVFAPETAAVPWTKPEDLVVDEKNPAAAIVAANAKEFLIARVDGFVQHIPATVKPEILNALITIDGGEVVNEEDLQK